MAESPTLFDTSWRPVENVHGLARWNDSNTAKEAARLVDARKVENAALAEFQRFGWLTASEVCDLLPDFYGPTVVSAVSRLKKRGVIVDSGTKRKSSHNRDSIVWRLPLNASGQEK